MASRSRWTTPSWRSALARDRRSDFAPPVVVATGIMVAATVPVPVPEGTPGWTGYAVHVLMYATLAGTLLWTGRRRGWPRPAAAAFLLAVGYGVVHECVQAFLPWRSASALDVLADAVGAAAAVAADAVRLRRLS